MMRDQKIRHEWEFFIYGVKESILGPASEGTGGVSFDFVVVVVALV